MDRKESLGVRAYTCTPNHCDLTVFFVLVYLWALFSQLSKHLSPPTTSQKFLSSLRELQKATDIPGMEEREKQEGKDVERDLLGTVSHSELTFGG